jgi:formylglycine-generating enzyme required for sulfatase activity
MLNPKLSSFVLAFSLAFCFAGIAYAQDASGRDPDKGVPIKAVTPKPAPVKVTTPPKPAKPTAKPVSVKKVNTAKAAVSKPVVAPVKKTPPPIKAGLSAALAVSRVTVIAPPNAQIELAGKMSGITGTDGKLVLDEVPVGVHSLKVTADGYESWNGVLEARTAVTDFTVSLKPRTSTGTLVITVNQPDVEVFINDKLNVKSVAGRSITIEGLLPGTHQLRAVKAGFKEWRSVVRVNVAESRPVEIVMVAGLSPEMVRVPAGEFMMGNDRGPKDSGPAHAVLLGEFEIARREVTNQFYKTFLDATNHPAPNPQLSGWQGNNFPAGKAEAAVTGISWDDAQAFCQWLTREAGGKYRLPTEAEWERATRVVGGSYQQVGVAWEWCQDWYDAEYYQRKDRLSPQGPALRPNNGAVGGKEKTPTGRVIRGGAASAAGRAVRAFERNAALPEQGRGDLGFRVMREVSAR